MTTDMKELGLRQQALLAALEISLGDPHKSFTAEDILVRAWEKDKNAWGLRGYEQDHPDPEKMYKELERRDKGLVGQGLLERVRPLIYRITPAGLAAASELEPSSLATREKAGRAIENSIRVILEHPVFQTWLKDASRPNQFREVGHFWGVAPGTPPKAARERVERVEATLTAALRLLDSLGVEEMRETRGRTLFDREDITRCLEFQYAMKQRFARELQILIGKDIGQSKVTA